MNNRVLYINLNEISKDDIIWGLVELGIEVERSIYKPSAYDIDYSMVELLIKEMAEYNIVISQNFSPTIAEACHRRTIPYISWIYDSPQTSAYRDEAFYSENFIFMFDKKECERLKKAGLKNVYYQPLAANVAYADRLEITENDISKYYSNLSFVGQIYKASYYENLYSGLPDLMKEHFDEIICKNKCHWDNNSIYGNLYQNELDAIYSIMNKKGLDENRIDINYLIETLMFTNEIAGRERVYLLNRASEITSVSLYTHNHDNYRDILKCNLYPATKNFDELYKIYYSSKINLNITLHSIETGIPQRVFDIMSVAGFTFSNYQQEIEELFDIDKEIVIYRNEEEFIDKINYYLSHEEERKKIGINGYLKVKDKYTYPKSLEKMFNIVKREWC